TAFLARPETPEKGPQCLILDLRLPGTNGLDLQAALRKSGAIQIILSAGLGDVTSSIRAIKTEAVDFLTKPVDEQDLAAAVQRGLALDRQNRQQETVLNTVRARHARLTPRERQVFALMTTGMLNKQIAGWLGTCERTIKVHRARVFKKMEADSLADLVRMADRLGLPSSPEQTGIRARVCSNTP
ncbi:MAG TPA: LuxR C-terminal-related transcriptional regulator, partial [Gemmatimonadales bacterium]|nr:LuxR C-terminal-related transcriptional regulator [Gemmatimonadales bacterium]